MTSLRRSIWASVLLTSVVFTSSAQALGLRGEEAARKLRQEIIAYEAPLGVLDWFKTADESYKLPVTRGFPQLATQLCWVYSTFNALESRYLYLHPNGKIELSRGVMQYLTMQDRVIRKFDGEDYLSERGDEVDALKLVKDFGLVAFSDYRDIFNSVEGSYSGVYQRANSGATREEKIQNLKTEMLKIFPALPSMTHSEGQAATPPQLSVDVLGGDEWLSYAPMTSGTEGMRDHPDPDARAETQAYFMPIEKIVAKIHDSLKNGAPVTYGADGHAIMLYGADYDASGKPKVYYMKDSYSPYFYTADPARVHARMLEITAIR